MHTADAFDFLISQVPADCPVLIAGPTASGKSSLAMKIAANSGGIIVNADALQVYDCWRILTARPSKEDEKSVPHALYGHVGIGAQYSVGSWLREVSALQATGQRLIVVGGTGLYFRALTEGLAEIPATPQEVRDDVQKMLHQSGATELSKKLHPDDYHKIDIQNGARVARALEVYLATNQSFSRWHAQTPPPLIPLHKATAVVLSAEKDWLNARIATRFKEMVMQGALAEVIQNQHLWPSDDPALQAIGAPELMRHLRGEISLEYAIEEGTIATRQYAKRQRTWFRKRMRDWYNLQIDQQ